jgi:TonB family protein
MRVATAACDRSEAAGFGVDFRSMNRPRGSVGLVITISLGVACSDKAPADAKTGAQPEKEATPVEAPITGDAVVRAGARLFFAPTGDAGLVLPTVATAPGIAVHVVGEESGRLVIETLSNQPPEHHCAATLEGLASFRLRFHVSKDDLLPVLTEPIAHPFVDGTKIEVAAGVAVPRGESEISVRGTPITLTVPSMLTARSYEPGAPFSTEGADGILAPLAGHALTYYGGKPLAEDALFNGGGGATLFGTTERSDDALVTVRNACLEATVRVSTQRLRTQVTGLMRGAVGDGDDDVWGALTGTEIAEAYGMGGGGTSQMAKAGATIWWADGQQAGQVVSDHRFATAPRDEGGRKCFDVQLVARNPAVLALCFASVDLEEVAGSGSGTIGLGNVGLLGKGGGGSSSVARVRQAIADIEGSLDKDIIRRIVRAHIDEIRHCYNQGLTKDPALTGRVTIEFTIAATGSVSASVVADSTVSDADVGTCAAKAVERWKFPKPEDGGNVVVKYPFVLEPG